MTRLPPVAQLSASSSGWGFFLCARKELRTGKSGQYLAIVLQDTSGDIKAKVFQDVDVMKSEFDAGEFVKVQGRGNLFNQKVELVLDRIRRVDPLRDALDGFREEDCIPCAPRPLDEMWGELQAHVEATTDTWVRALLERVLADHGDRLRIWPAAQAVHHAYRGGLLEHILKIIETVRFLADAYGANRDLLVAGAILHDIGKLQELSYSVTTDYSVAGNLIGHIPLGAHLVRDSARAIDGFPDETLVHLEHLVLSHHGARSLGSPVEPMTVEAFILAAADDLDAKIHQVRKHIETDDSDGPFTAFHRRLERVLLKPTPPR